MAPLEIRPVRPAEHAAVGTLCVAAYAHAHAVSEDYAALLRDVAGRAGDAQVLVALEDGRPVGSVTFIAHGGRSHEIAGPDEAEFRFLAVAPEAQRGGVARALVERCVAETAALGRARLVCSSGDWMDGAHRLYGQLGFRRAPERDWSPKPGVHLLAFVLAAPR
ncbi:MAG: GNAT family N-acetyltransferase [Solirubrobacteraceae bacterium]|nr:GNAT family N-acetyltransferase [Solirubrobacteraceae bacterium]